MQAVWVHDELRVHKKFESGNKWQIDMGGKEKVLNCSVTKNTTLTEVSFFISWLECSLFIRGGLAALVIQVYLDLRRLNFEWEWGLKEDLQKLFKSLSLTGI